MTKSHLLQGAAALVLVGVAAAPTQAQSNFTFDESRWVLIDNQNGRQWPCGKGLAWIYNNTYSATYIQAKDVAPGRYSTSPYGSGGGWRLPATAELADAINKGLYSELRAVTQYCIDQQAAAGISFGHPDFISFSMPEAWWMSWVVDKVTRTVAYTLVLSTGERVKRHPDAHLYYLLVR